MARARRHQRLLSGLAFGLLSLATAVLGRILIHTIDVGRHVHSPVQAQADYYPVLLAALKVGLALLAARLAWRAVRAHAAERAARRVLGTIAAGAAPRLRIALTPRLWAAFFVVPSLIYLVQTDAEGAVTGRWPLLSPWLHSSALPVFAFLGVLLAAAWSAVQRWLADYERYAEETAARAGRVRFAAEPAPVRYASVCAPPPRFLFGLSLDSRPPPVTA